MPQAHRQRHEYNGRARTREPDIVTIPPDGILLEYEYTMGVSAMVYVYVTDALFVAKVLVALVSNTLSDSAAQCPAGESPCTITHISSNR